MNTESYKLKERLSLEKAKLKKKLELETNKVRNLILQNYLSTISRNLVGNY